MKLRDYQQTAIDEVRAAFLQHRRVLLVAPTGAGKTVMFSYIAKSAIDKRRKICILAHREELIEQISQTLAKFGVNHGFIAARRPIDFTKQVQVAGVHTLKNRAARIDWKPDLIICDEAHHATAGSWAKILQAYPNAHVLGVTATPERLDGTGLGNVFGAMVRGPEVSDLIANGFLSPVRYYCPKTVNTDGMKMRMGDYRHSDVDERVNNSRVTGEAIDWYRKLCDGAPAVAFCASIKHSEHVAETFRAAGYCWTSLDSTMTSEDRRAAVLGLGNGSLHGISSCDIISEGFDLPIVTAAILLRPTASLGLYLQQIGRVLRVAPGKSHAIIVDHVGNCGSTRGQQWIEKHGFAEDVREWTLEGRAKRSGAAPVRLCGICYAVVPIGADVCPECGTIKPPAEEKPLEAEAGELEEVVAAEKRKEPGLNIIQKLTLEYLESLQPKFNAARRCVQFNRESESILPENGFMDIDDLRHKLSEYMYAVYVDDKKLIKHTWRQFVNSHATHTQNGYKHYLNIDRRKLESDAITLEDWQNIAKIHGYNPGWAWHRFNLRKGFVDRKKNKHFKPALNDRVTNSIRSASNPR